MKHAPTQFLGSDRQTSPLIVVKAQPLASELFAQDTVLFVKILDDVLLALVQEAGQGNQQEPKGIKCQTHSSHRNTRRRCKKPREISSEPRT